MLQDLFAPAIERYRRLALPERLLPLAYGLLLASLAAPWLEAQPFLGRGFGSGTSPPVLMHGIEVPGGPLVLLASLVGLGALFFGEEAGLRQGTNVAVFLVGGVWVLTFWWGKVWGCYLCQDPTLLWGATMAAVGSGLGLALALWALDWGPLQERLEAELSG